MILSRTAIGSVMMFLSASVLFAHLFKQGVGTDKIMAGKLRMRSREFTAGVFFLLCSQSLAFGQPSVEVPLRVTDSVAVHTLYFGIFPGAHYCIDPADSMNGHVEMFLIPPEPMVFDARFVAPRQVPVLCFDQGSPCDYRPFRNIIQRDTFRVRAQRGMGSVMVLSWPAGLSRNFTQLWLRYFDQILLQNVLVNMLTDTTADLAGAGDPAVASIYAGEEPLSVESNPTGMLPTFSLHQNYPNPFNPNTTIKFALPKAGHVTLRVYDLLGQQVVTLLDEPLGPGTYEKIFSAEGLASGVYFYRLSAGGFVQTKKLLLLR